MQRKGKASMLQMFPKGDTPVQKILLIRIAVFDIKEFTMNEYTVNVTEVEELQMISNTTELDRIFARAHSTIIQGGTVVLSRQNPDGTAYKFEEFTTEDDLKTYKESVVKYL